MMLMKKNILSLKQEVDILRDQLVSNPAVVAKEKELFQIKLEYHEMKEKVENDLPALDSVKENYF